jgi:AcrR family transcriptional regulator
VPAADRRQAIINAALEVFSEKGFAAARLEDVAARAHVAKGTIYLYFPDKAEMFRQLVRDAAQPLFERIAALAAADMPARTMLDGLFHLFQTEVLGTQRKQIVRLILTEGPRFPEIAAFYHSEVIGRVMPVLRDVLQRAAARGELASDAPARFPHLVVAPLIMSILWDALFSRLQPLDVAGLFAAHRELLTGMTKEQAP